MKLISAICTPLDDDGRLHAEGLRRHLDDQWRAGIDGVLIGGTMGLLQLLADVSRRLARLLDAIRAPWPLFPACTVILNARGIPGSVAPRPMRPLAASQREELLALPVVRELIAETTSSRPQAPA